MEFWCNVCDAKIVDSTKPETGKFYTVFGHRIDFEKRVIDSHDLVLFAVCSDCKLEETIKEANDFANSLNS